MARDAKDNYRAPDGSSNENRAPHIITRLLITTAWIAGLLSIVMAALYPKLEWRLFSMTILAFLLSPLSAELRGPEEKAPIRLPLVHSILFASTLSLGSAAALPGAFAGFGRLLYTPGKSRPLHQVLCIALKPALVCVITAATYIRIGGSILRPQGVYSILPLLCAGIAYITASALLVYLSDKADKRKDTGTTPRGITVAAGWSVCLLAGYPLAVLYAFAPPYVLLLPVMAVPLAQFAMREPEQQQPTEQQVEDSSHNVNKKLDEPAGFIDPATGLASRRYLEMFLHRELSRSERMGKSLSIAIFDIDGLKKLSGKIDRGKVDAAVATTGKRLKSELREYDLVARYSTGRMIIVLPDTSANRAFEIIARLHRSAALVIIGNKQASISVGIAVYPVHGTSAEELINSAHRALNRGRIDGSNRVHSLERLQKAG